MGPLRDLRHLDKEFRYLKIYQKKLLKLRQKKKYSGNRRKHARVTELQQITYVMGSQKRQQEKKIFEEIVTKSLRIQSQTSGIPSTAKLLNRKPVSSTRKPKGRRQQANTYI